MISSLEIENFKCFAHLRLPLHPLSLLTGFNSGGKSSAIQPLLLLAQAVRSDATSAAVPLNGALVRLGTVGDVLPSEGVSQVIKFTLSGGGIEADWHLTARPGERALRTSVRRDLQETKVEPQSDLDAHIRARAAFYASLRDLAYLSAVREGQSETFPVPDAESQQVGDVGIDGRFAAYWYAQFADEDVPSGRRHPQEVATTMRKQLDAWLGNLFPGAQATAQTLGHTSLLSLQFRSTEIGEWRKPANVGYGFTYAFPILVALLTARDGQTVIIDSPEAHLHPFAQSQMGRILGQFAAAGVRILVETHSDHLLNGVRLAVKQKLISQHDVGVHFFTGARGAEHGVVSPRLDSEGRIDHWPAGFFDQSERDMARLSGWE
jgi:predicted ATPase